MNPVTGLPNDPAVFGRQLRMDREDTVLGEEDPVPISTLAERTGSANSTVSGIVDRLEKLGLAKRQRSELDRRVIYVCATEKYAALREKTSTDVSGYFDSLLRTMPEEDRKLKPIRPRARAGRAAVILELLSIPEAGQRNHRAPYQDPEPARTQAQVLLQARESA